MSSLNSQRKDCRDSFNAFLVSTASYSGYFEFPIIQSTHYVPNAVISFSNAISAKDHDRWVHFYQDDYRFERLWRNPQRYLQILRRFNGVILPDWSTYRDMPLVMQLWNIYRSRAIGHWLQSNGLRIIVNIRFGDQRTYRPCCDGVSKGCTIAIGTHGTLKNSEDRAVFVEGLDSVIHDIEPTVIVVYGSAPESIFGVYRRCGIEIVQFESDFATSRSGGL